MKSLLNHEVHYHSKLAKWIVFIHGAGGSTKTWNRQTIAFSTYYNLLLIDLRDHGESKEMIPAYSSYDFKTISNDIKQVMNKYAISKAHFLTLSFGSVLMQDFASRYPKTVDQVIFIGGIFNGGILIRSFVYLARFLNLFLSYPTMYRTFSYLLMPRKRNQVARRLYQTQAEKISQSEYMKWLGLYKEFFSLLQSFNQQTIHFPALIVMGSMDYMFLKSAHDFAAKHGNVQIQEIPKAGHIANIEQPAYFNKISLGFLDPEEDLVETPQTTVQYDTSLA